MHAASASPTTASQARRNHPFTTIRSILKSPPGPAVLPPVRTLPELRPCRAGIQVLLPGNRYVTAATAAGRPQLAGLLPYNARHDHQTRRHPATLGLQPP